MMLQVLFYGYCVGIVASRKLEKATYENVALRCLSANQHPDHDRLATFRRRHLPARSALFVEVLPLCQKAGLVKLGHVALDGTRIKANASRPAAGRVPTESREPILYGRSWPSRRARRSTPSVARSWSRCAVKSSNGAVFVNSCCAG